jgi:hypothetical protein
MFRGGLFNNFTIMHVSVLLLKLEYLTKDGYTSNKIRQYTNTNEVLPRVYNGKCGGQTVKACCWL